MGPVSSLLSIWYGLKKVGDEEFPGGWAVGADLTDEPRVGGQERS